MISHEQNEQLTRIGPGTLMGDLMRQYWMPAGLSRELPHPDCDPVRMRLLGEDLIGFRTTSGKVGLIQEKCPHRGASLFMGRVEDDGIRCVYHGWQFDCAGTCTDMPSEPPDSKMKKYLKARTYPCVERGGIIWAYMGPRESPPPLPELEANVEAQKVQVLGMHCNWLQVLENSFDPAHGNFLHWGGVTKDSEWMPWMDSIFRDRENLESMTSWDGKMYLEKTEWGFHSANRRPAVKDQGHLYNVVDYIMPLWHLAASSEWNESPKSVAYVPVSDTYTQVYFIGDGIGDWPVGERTTDWYGRFPAEPNEENDFLIDRDVQRNEKGTLRAYSGITELQHQDIAIQMSQGPIQDRTLEHLGSSDKFIVEIRKQLLGAANALRDDGSVPPNVEKPENYAQRTGFLTLVDDADLWSEVAKQTMSVA